MATDKVASLLGRHPRKAVKRRQWGRFAPRTSAAEPRRWVVMVASDQPALRAHLTEAFASDSQVRIIEATDTDAPKHSDRIARRLRAQGAVILREEDYRWRYV